MDEQNALKLTINLTLDAYWLWWTLALLLGAAELAVPGAFMIWLGLAAGLTGLVALVYQLAVGGEPGLEVQLAVFAALSIVTVIWGRRWARRGQASDTGGFSRRVERLLGRMVVLVEPITHGAGRAQLDDSIWEVRGPDAPAGATMRIVGTEGAVLLVEAAAPAEAGQDSA